MTSDADLIQALEEAHGRATKGEWIDGGRHIYRAEAVHTHGHLRNTYGISNAVFSEKVCEMHGQVELPMDALDPVIPRADRDLIVLAHNSLPRLLQLAKEAISAREVVEAARPYPFNPHCPDSEDDFDLPGDMFSHTLAIGQEQDNRLTKALKKHDAALTHLSEARKEGK